jgi:hypothetical protein
LIGDLFSNFDELFAAVSEFAELPAPLPHGRSRGGLKRDFAASD